MEIFSPSPQNASRLIGKALAPRPNPHRDEEYRDLLQLYTDDFDFQDLVKQIANGLNLNIIYGSQYGLVLGAKSAESQCAVRLTEVNQYFSEVDKAVILICMAVTTMAFFPTAQNLEDPDYNARGKCVRCATAPNGYSCFGFGCHYPHSFLKEFSNPA